MSTLTPTPIPAPTLPSQTPVHAGVTLLAIAASVALLYFGRVFFITMVVAITIAFLLDPVVTAFVKLRLPRAVASFIVCSSALLILYLLGLGLYNACGRSREANLSSRHSQAIPGSAATAGQSGSRTWAQETGKQAGGNADAASDS
jgi:hypothetical protein